MTTNPSKSASERAALVREARLRIDEWQRVAGDPVALQNVGARLSMTCDRLAAALEAADADTRRLDWLSGIPRFRGSQCADGDAEFSGWDPIVEEYGRRRYGATLRDAIDAARAAEEPTR